MRSRPAFTMIEMIISVMVITVLTGTIMFVYLGSFKSWKANDDRSALRIQMAQALELMTQDLLMATSLDDVTPSSITFTADLGEGLQAYRYHILQDGFGKNNLLRGLTNEAPVMLSGIKFEVGQDWFAQTDRLVTIDIKAVSGDAEIEMRTQVRPRNF